MTDQQVLVPTVGGGLSVIGEAGPEPSEAMTSAVEVQGLTSSPWNAVGVALTGVGVLLMLFFVYLYAFTPLTHTRDQHRLLQSLVGNRSAVHALAIGHLPSEGNPVAILTIPTLHQHQVVVMGTSSADLQQAPGLMMHTALPGDPGDAVVAGRRVSYGAPFGSLGHLVPGNEIQVLDGAGNFTFRVLRVSTVPGGYRDVPSVRGQSWLTLVTSSSPLVDNGTVVVVAKSVSPPGLVDASKVLGKSSVRIDFSGDLAAGLLALAWSVAFLLGLFLTARAVRRWHQPWLTYLLGAPVLLASGLFACESLARMLPATL